MNLEKSIPWTITLGDFWIPPGATDVIGGQITIDVLFRAKRLSLSMAVREKGRLHVRILNAAYVPYSKERRDLDLGFADTWPRESRQLANVYHCDAIQAIGCLDVSQKLRVEIRNCGRDEAHGTLMVSGVTVT